MLKNWNVTSLWNLLSVARFKVSFQSMVSINRWFISCNLHNKAIKNRVEHVLSKPIKERHRHAQRQLLESLHLLVSMCCWFHIICCFYGPRFCPELHGIMLQTVCRGMIEISTRYRFVAFKQSTSLCVFKYTLWCISIIFNQTDSAMLAECR